MTPKLYVHCAISEAKRAQTYRLRRGRASGGEGAGEERDVRGLVGGDGLEVGADAAGEAGRLEGRGAEVLKTLAVEAGPSATSGRVRDARILEVLEDQCEAQHGRVDVGRSSAGRVVGRLATLDGRARDAGDHGEAEEGAEVHGGRGRCTRVS